jgi:Zn-finger protein
MQKEEHWRGKHYAFFANRECEYFPCHSTNDPDNFNCLFCYCPLYVLGEDCGGNFRYTEKGRKDCTNCMKPHVRDNYGKITERYAEVAELMDRQKK